MTGIKSISSLLFLLALSASSLAADTGTVSGKVVDAKGAAVAEAHVAIIHPRTEGEKPAASTQPSKGHEHRYPHALAKVLTASDGSFTLANIPPGKYVLVAWLKGTGHGRDGDSQHPIEVTAGQNLDAGTITLDKKAPGKHADKK